MARKKRQISLFFNKSFIILVLIFSIICIHIFFLYTKNINDLEKQRLERNTLENLNRVKIFKKEDIISKYIKRLDKNKEYALEIPRILEKSPIKKGTDQAILNEYIGLFYISPYLDGNVSLAAHNRGFKKNYFQNLKDIKLNDEIIYIVGETKFKYLVSKKYIVHENDLSCIKDEGEREITLITCVKDRPSKRLVVKGRYIGLK